MEICELKIGFGLLYIERARGESQRKGGGIMFGHKNFNYYWSRLVNKNLDGGDERICMHVM